MSQLAVMIMKTVTLPSEPASFTAVGSFPITGHAQAWKSLNVFNPWSLLHRYCHLNAPYKEAGIPERAENTGVESLTNPRASVGVGRQGAGPGPAGHCVTEYIH